MLSFNFLHNASHTTHLETLTLPRTTHYSDEELLSGIEQGDKALMAELYKKHSTSFNSYILNRLNDLQHQYTILNDIFLKLWEGKVRWDRRLPFKIYIFKILRHKIDVLNSISIDDNVSGAQLHFSKSNQTKQKTKISSLHEKCKVLPADLKSLLYVIYNEGLSYNEVAIIENSTINMIEQRLLSAFTLIKNQ